ncbi:hypothetical protein GCM10009006_00910 [Haloarcula argentinensis]|uniref:Uncharacterized protein n=1 Tax=Haloarcula argentinensis TaxID=43776 RepID=A0A830F8Q8_HALAR|nr:hypothetical protein GCM10009006_00910 [Haloarcula argentinensis]
MKPRSESALRTAGPSAVKASSPRATPSVIALSSDYTGLNTLCHILSSPIGNQSTAGVAGENGYSLMSLPWDMWNHD